MQTRYQLNLLLTALMFYTRIPVSKELPYSPELLNQSRKYFTCVGLIVGVLVCLVFLLAQTILPLPIAIALSMIASVLITGAFHEDGFADSCDALGGGWEPKQILTIMKDSRIGTYGTVGLVGMLGLKFLLLLELASSSVALWCLCCIAAHTISRHHSSRLIKHYEYVQDIDKSKVKPIADAPLSRNAEVFSLLIALLPCALLAFNNLLLPVIAYALTHWSANQFMRYCERRLGGYTGDILGAIQQITEVVFLLTCVAVFAF